MQYHTGTPLLLTYDAQLLLHCRMFSLYVRIKRDLKRRTNMECGFLVPFVQVEIVREKGEALLPRQLTSVLLCNR